MHQRIDIPKFALKAAMLLASATAPDLAKPTGLSNRMRVTVRNIPRCYQRLNNEKVRTGNMHSAGTKECAV